MTALIVGLVIVLGISIASNVLLWQDYRAMAERWKDRMDGKREEKENA